MLELFTSMEAWHNMKLVEHNAITGETTERDFTPDEIKALKISNDLLDAEQAQMDAKQAAKEVAKLPILERLGLTAEEAKILLA
jgi:hypothetical protein